MNSAAYRTSSATSSDGWMNSAGQTTCGVKRCSVKNRGVWMNSDGWTARVPKRFLLISHK